MLAWDSQSWHKGSAARAAIGGMHLIPLLTEHNSICCALLAQPHSQAGHSPAWHVGISTGPDKHAS